MITGILFLSISFLWLMFETKFLSIRLQRHYKRIIKIVKYGEFDALGSIMSMVPINPIKGIIAVTVGIISYNIVENIDITRSIIDHPFLLKSPGGNYYGYFEFLEAKRISRRHHGWMYEPY